MADNLILKNLLPTPPPATATGDFSDKPTAEEAAALGKMYHRVPEPPDPGSLYSTVGMLRTKLNANFIKLGDAGLLSIQQQEKERSDYATLMRETNLPLRLAETLHDRWTSARLAARAGGDTGRELDLDNEESRRTLRETWGAKDAEELITRTKKFVTSHPKLKAIVNTGGIGSQADIVQMMVSHVRDIDFR